jgi:hypothetical protein
MTTHISLQLRHVSRDLEELAASLALPVSRIWVAGTARRSPRGDALAGQHQDSYVALKIVLSSGTIVGAIEVVRQAFSNVSNDLRSTLADPALRKVLYWTLETGGEEIDLTALKTLIDLGVELGLD